jgi:hypothetical protein
MPSFPKIQCPTVAKDISEQMFRLFHMTLILVQTLLQRPGSIPDANRFLCVAVGLVGIHSALVRINEELLERKVAAPV